MSSGGNQFSGFKYSGGKNRMAGDYLKDFSERYTDNTDFTESQSKDYRGNVKNNNVASFLGNSTPNSAVQQPLGPDSIQKPESKDTTAKKPVSGSQPSYLSNETYLNNQKIIGNYNGKDHTSNAVGAAYNADLMSGLNYQRAVKQNKKFEDQYATQQSIAAGNDHGIHGESNYAPKSKEYYDYLNTYEGPKSYDQVVSQYKANTAGMTPDAIAAREKDLGQKGERAYDVWEKWQKDKMDYEAAWGSGQSVSSQKGWS